MRLGEQGSVIRLATLVLFFLSSLNLHCQVAHPSPVRERCQRWQAAAAGIRIIGPNLHTRSSNWPHKECPACKAQDIVKDVCCESNPVQLPLATLHGSCQSERGPVPRQNHMAAHLCRGPPL